MNALATNRLNQIAVTVNSEHVLFETAMRESLAHAVNVGNLLNEAKELVKHGEWGAWITDNCQFGERTAQNYMRIAARYPELAKAQHVADLTYREAVALLAEPKPEAEEVTPKSIRAFAVIAEELEQKASQAETLDEIRKVSQEFHALSKLHKKTFLQINDKQDKLERAKLLEAHDANLQEAPYTDSQVIPLERCGMTQHSDLFIGVNMWQKNFGGWCAEEGCWETIETKKEWGNSYGRPGWDRWGLEALGAPRSCWHPVFCSEHHNQTDFTEIVQTVRMFLVTPDKGEA